MPFAKLAAFGAIAVALGVAAVYALVVFITIPTPSGGIDWTHAQLTWISVGGVVLVLIAIHVTYARVLLAAARDTG
jgi:hypothetical protein